ncbi:MAG: AmmeMemoRadiSam system protein B [Calditrichaeota bacterium]|nr:MAG: AmmeMemoRadiSam system protein B [Calditrichota bacterium]
MINYAGIFCLTAFVLNPLLFQERTSSMDFRPQLRFVDAFPVETENGEMIALRDPSGIARDTILLSRMAVFILQYFTGEHDVETILRILTRDASLELEKKQLLDLIKTLDENLFLQNERYLEAKKIMETEFIASGIRTATYAGASYPADREELNATLVNFYQEEGGAGVPGPVNGLPTPAGVIAPHIDLRIGGATYTHAYKAMVESPVADVYVIIGTGHSGLKNIYSVLPIDFETPLGRVETDKDFIKNLQANTNRDYSADVLLHKTEHTIEFQVVFLQQAFADKPFKIVPVLASFNYQMLEDPYFKPDQECIEDFTTALKKTINEYPGKVTVLASVDMAHVGPRYGDKNIPDDGFLADVRQADMNALEFVKAADARGWAKAISDIEDKYRICGFAPIYTLLSSTDAKQGKVLKYDKGVMDDNESVVSYCSAVLY